MQIYIYMHIYIYNPPRASQVGGVRRHAGRASVPRSRSSLPSYSPQPSVTSIFAAIIFVHF